MSRHKTRSQTVYAGRGNEGVDCGRNPNIHKHKSLVSRDKLRQLDKYNVMKKRTGLYARQMYQISYGEKKEKQKKKKTKEEKKNRNVQDILGRFGDL
jgi:hypothetical protein